MFSPFPKIAAAVLVFSLLIAFFAKDCTHQKSTINNQASETKNMADGAQTGLWGGEHISLEVTAQGGRVEYDCAHGTIDQKIVPDGQGHFDFRGTHVREHGGPSRKDEAPDSHPARFIGQIKGNTMTLTVTEMDTKEVLGTFTLAFGQKPHIVKCR